MELITVKLELGRKPSKSRNLVLTTNLVCYLPEFSLKKMDAFQSNLYKNIPFFPFLKEKKEFQT
jgi:hypothetical protein